VIDTLFLSAAVGGAVFAAVCAAMKSEPITVVGRSKADATDALAATDAPASADASADATPDATAHADADADDAAADHDTAADDTAADRGVR